MIARSAAIDGRHRVGRVRAALCIFALEPALAAAEPRLPAGIHLEGDATPSVVIPTGEHSALRVGGYVETYYSYNFRRPSNGVTEFRAFDNRHNSISLQAIALDVGWASRSVAAHVVLQAGSAANTYYGASEPTIAGTPLTPGTTPAAVRAIQQATLAWSPLPDQLVVDAGLFLSPIGPESLATHQNFHWSHSPLFFALPFYHAGARVQWLPNAAHAIRLGVYNGWNNALDNNAEKTLGLDYTYKPTGRATVGAAYFGGVERPTGAPEGRAWRNLFDVYLLYTPIRRLQTLLNTDVGFEPNTLGLSGWAAGNLSARVELMSWLFTAARGSLFLERRAESARVQAAAIAIPSSRVAAATLTLEAVPAKHVSCKLELRQDAAKTPIYFAGAVAGDGSANAPYLPNARSQTTLTLGATAWF